MASASSRSFFNHPLALVRGGGYWAGGVVYRLHRAGFGVIVTERKTPTFIRRPVSYGEAVYSKWIRIHGLTALKVDVDSVEWAFAQGGVAVLADPDGEAIPRWQPLVVVDARMAGRNVDTTINDAPLVIGLGPGFTAGVDCHAVIETTPGHNLGRVYEQGSADSDTDAPDRPGLLRAPIDGHVMGHVTIGETVEAGQHIADIISVGAFEQGMAAGAISLERAHPSKAPTAGVLRGLIHPRVAVTAGMPIAEVDASGIADHCFTLSSDALAVGGGVLEAILASPQLRFDFHAATPNHHEAESGV